MAVMHSPHKTSTTLLRALKNDYPQIRFEKGEGFVWSPDTVTVFYPETKSDTFAYSLLHELGHALHKHTTFKSDLDLLRIERDAWDKALVLSRVYAIEIPSDHIEECMDTYRDWLYARSLCPYCKQCGIQTAKTMYACVFCNREWKVSKSRLCKVTRRMVKKVG